MTKAEKELQRVTAKRELLFRRVQLCYDAGKVFENDPKNKTKFENFMIRFGTINQTVTEYRETVQEIVSLKQQLEPDTQPSFDLLEAFEDLHDHIQYIGKHIVSPTAANTDNSDSSTRSRIYMPKLELLKFNGEDLTLWPIWYENFKQLVHLKSEFSDAEKLQYLLSSLTSRALKTCTGIEPVPNNYLTIFKLLEDTYQDKKYLVNIYLDRLFNFKPVLSSSSNNLQAFLEKFDTNVNALKHLNLENLSDYILTYLAMSRLPSETVSDFELIRTSKEVPTYNELIQFIKRQSKVMYRPDKSKHNPHSFSHNTSKNIKTFITNDASFQDIKTCRFCRKGNHLLKECQPFKSSAQFTRFKFVKTNQMCINCFSKKHSVQNCPSKFRCLSCQGKHHTLLHREEANHNIPETTNIIPSTSNTNCNQTSAEVITMCSHTGLSNKIPKVVLLSTALINVIDKWGKKHTLRFLVDNASMSNLLAFDVCKKLGLSYREFLSNVVGVGGVSRPIKGRTSLTIHSNADSGVKYVLEFMLIEHVTNCLPDVPIDTRTLDHLKHLKLADPTFHLPGRIDGILGAELYAEILGSHKIVGNPTAVQTTLGYLIVGLTTPLTKKDQTQPNITCVTLESLLEKILEIEDYPERGKSMPSEDDQLCEEIYAHSYQRDSTGRYTVSLPFKEQPTKLGNSYKLAEKRLLALERRLDNTPNLRKTYSSIIQDYLNQGHMSLVNQDRLHVPSYYSAHHCVWKPGSTSTPCRIVFDFSMKCDNGVSLNDILFKGPKLQNNIFTILLNFRLFPICLNADIRAMYRQINLNKSHRQYQRILWRFEVNEPIQVYELNTVTFGVSSSPFLSLRTILQLIKDESHNFPKVKEFVERDIFMDDLICSVPNVDHAKILQSQTREFFSTGGFEIVKWMSNSIEVLSDIPKDIQSPAILEFGGTNCKILGLQYNPLSDQFSFNMTSEITGPCTKRTLLSFLSRIFDPLGFISPVALFIKLLIKSLWTLKLDWDQPAPIDIEKRWSQLKDDFSVFNNIKIPRHILVFENTELNVIGFCDASMLGYASAIYIQTIDISGQIAVTFLCSRGRVAPMSEITLPRLELCAATQLAKLVGHVLNCYSNRHSIKNIYAFSDSMITLSWIHSDPRKWKTFVSNRVTQIQSCLSPSHWHYVPGKQNPADCASRGVLPSTLMNHESWFCGPSWLQLPSNEWPIRSLSDNSEYDNCSQEIKVHVTVNEIDSPIYSLIKYFSSWSKLLRSVVYVLRFVKLLPIRKKISNSDLEIAEIYVIRAIQNKHFPSELKLLKQNKICSTNLRRLNPFIQDEVIRVGGRLSRSEISFNQKHPLLLPKSDPGTYLIIKFYHKLYGHPGAHLLHSILSRRYWIISARNSIRKCTWECNICFRNNPKPKMPFMSDLPWERVNQSKAFLNTGIDYTGSFQITLARRRGSKSHKAYICLFTCLATRAIHLELASNLSTESFLSALKRFLSRRGNCQTIFSDNGTNFVGAQRKLNEIYALIKSIEFKEAFQNELNLQKINWRFNPPAASHFGGCFESQIKCTKVHLSRIIGNQILTYEEFYTVLCQIEAVLNSRPLTTLSSDPNDLSALSPAHFLCSTPLGSLPAPDVSLTPLNHLDRFKLLDAMVQHFWNRWQREYLMTLQARQKWNTPVNPPRVGTIVVLMQENLPPLQWPLAIITELLPGPDGITRVARIKTKTNTYIRPVVKLCPLPSQ